MENEKENTGSESITDFNGKRVNIQSYQESLREWPSSCRKSLADDGTPYLSNCVTREPECGCRIVGNGTLQFPLSILHCEVHSKVNKLLAKNVVADFSDYQNYLMENRLADDSKEITVESLTDFMENVRQEEEE